MSEKLFFVNDYGEGCHPKVLEKLAATNLEHLAGYGSDKYCESAKEKIRKACDCPEADIWFISGGTQTNAIVISALLKSYEGVISAVTGHINGHEAGAVEHLGCKVLPLPQHEGKIDAGELKEYMRTFYGDANHEHMVFPGMVYISHPTEYGTLYTKDELTALRNVCQEYEMPLFMDGARMGYGLMSYQTDVTLPDIAKLCDVFYIGGTKVGALCGEAVVFTKGNMPRHFLPIVKQNGALLARRRLMGVQFDTLFTDNLYFDISRHAIDMAQELKKVFAEKGYRFFIDSPTNQQFIVLENEKMQALSQFVDFSFWEKLDENHTVVRFATSWATKKEDIDKLAALL